MIFEAIVYHIDNTVIIKLLSTDLTDLPLMKNYTPDTGEFFIQRRNTFELDTTGLFLPGDEDFDKPMPRSTSRTFKDSLSCQNWITNFQQNYKQINECEPVIINVEQIGFHTEDSPEVRLD